MSNPPEWDALLEAQAHPRSGVHVTGCMACPRKDALLRAGAKVDYSRLTARLTGTMVHRMLETVRPETAEVRVAGRLFGLDIVGSVDRLRDGLVVDYKTSNGKSRPTGVYPEHVWQFEAYRFLLAQGGTVTRGWSVHYFWQFREWVDPFEHIGPLWTEEALGRFRPHGGSFTTREIAQMAEAVEQGAPAASIPLVGAGQTMGKGTACGYCEVEGPCGAEGLAVDF